MHAAGLPAPMELPRAWSLPLEDEPFAALGRPLGLSGDAVLEMLRNQVARGRLQRVGPMYGPGGGPCGRHEQMLMELLAGGLPLVPRPYEAMAAVLGCPQQQVRDTLAQWLHQGRLLRIGAVRAPPEGAGPRQAGA